MAVSLTYLPINVGRDSDNRYELTNKGNKPIVYKHQKEKKKKKQPTCAISSVFLSFSSQVTVISWINFSDSSNRSFNSGDFIACRK